MLPRSHSILLLELEEVPMIMMKASLELFVSRMLSRVSYSIGLTIQINLAIRTCCF
jgi:hypothetical protein